ncbi:2-hydroxychromene-2-carboxylate isomerase [Cypionkella sp.]|uniref:2-hydroxychromene-2-carboxylate isomerase n=1 Tax=Cypionkella sp. TaxID=2811411 RepID=UPI002639B50A|nr:DsbA family protein [Cypionkella sp.]MDB5664854.1 nahD [Cypionkella sp.]
MTQKIDYFFGLGSPWAYVGLDAFTALATAHMADIVPHVIPVIEENGGIYSRNRPPLRRAYWFTDLKRWANRRGVTLEFTGRDALSDIAPAGDLVVAAWLRGDDWLSLARAFHQAFWGRAEDIGAANVRARITTEAGLDSVSLEAFAKGPEVAARKAESLEIARKAGVFGLPSYIVNGELFWGQDSLPFLDSHLKGEKLIS